MLSRWSARKSRCSVPTSVIASRSTPLLPDSRSTPLLPGELVLEQIFVRAHRHIEIEQPLDLLTRADVAGAVIQHLIDAAHQPGSIRNRHYLAHSGHAHRLAHARQC